MSIRCEETMLLLCCQTGDIDIVTSANVTSELLQHEDCTHNQHTAATTPSDTAGKLGETSEDLTVDQS